MERLLTRVLLMGVLLGGIVDILVQHNMTEKFDDRIKSEEDVNRTWNTLVEWNLGTQNSQEETNKMDTNGVVVKESEEI